MFKKKEKIDKINTLEKNISALEKIVSRLENKNNDLAKRIKSNEEKIHSLECYKKRTELSMAKTGSVFSLEIKSDRCYGYNAVYSGTFINGVRVQDHNEYTTGIQEYWFTYYGTTYIIKAERLEIPTSKDMGVKIISITGK